MAVVSASAVYYTDSIFYLLSECLGFRVAGIDVSLGLIFDELSSYFLCILDATLLLCFVFLLEYFDYDGGGTNIALLSSLFSHLALWYFCAFDFVMLIFLWEAISLVSFLLVQHWSFRLSTYKAGLKVFVISQVGDLFLFGLALALMGRFGTADLGEIIGQLPLIVFECISLPVVSVAISLPIFLTWLASAAVMLKSAQFVFYP